MSAPTRSQSDATLPAAPSDDQYRGERLQKVLAAAGVGSRRECEQLIQDGRVEVDRKFVTELGTRVNPHEQQVRVDGVTIPHPKLRYYLVNKPTGVVSTNSDPAGRPRVVDLINTDERLFTVGRLDQSSEGLILATNDGALANRLTHPRYGIEKTYTVHVVGHPHFEELKPLLRGIHLAEGVARVAGVKIKKRHKGTTELEIILQEGRNREIRRLLARIGHKVVRLTRIGIGPVRLGDLPSGSYRSLTLDEVQLLRNATEKKPGKKIGGNKIGVTARGRGRTQKSPPTGMGTVIGFDEYLESTKQVRGGKAPRKTVKKKAARGKPAGQPGKRANNRRTKRERG